MLARRELGGREKFELAMLVTDNEMAVTEGSLVAANARLIKFIADEGIRTTDLRGMRLPGLMQAFTAAQVLENPASFPPGSLGRCSLIAAGIQPPPWNGDIPDIGEDELESESE